jgi:hypothetical protein
MRQLLAVFVVLLGSYSFAGTTVPDDTTVPVKRVVLYDTGLAFIEHSGRIRGSQEINFEFSSAQLDTVLKSLTVLDSGGQPTGVRYDVPITSAIPQTTIAPPATNDIRHLTVSTQGKGERDITITYVLEAPVLRHSYRVVLQPSTPGNALLQGWIMVHNTTHSDWNNVQMSLVNGALPSLIKQSSKPEYFPKMGDPPCSPESVPGSISFYECYGKSAEEATGDIMFMSRAQQLAKRHNQLRSRGNPPDRISIPPVASVTLQHPVTMNRDQAALVPYIEVRIPAEQVTFWNNQPREPLEAVRAVWLVNSTNRILGQGTVNVTDGGFAGEGLMDEVLPGERWLVPYTADDAVRITAGASSQQSSRRVRADKGTLILSGLDLQQVNYSIENAAASPRDVLLKHKTDGWKLDPNVKPAEVADAYVILRANVEAGKTHVLSFEQQRPYHGSYELAHLRQEQVNQWIALKIFKPEVETKLLDLAAARLEITQLEQKARTIREQIRPLERPRSPHLSAEYGCVTNSPCTPGTEEREPKLSLEMKKQLSTSTKELNDVESERKTIEEKLRALANSISFDEAL